MKLEQRILSMADLMNEQDALNEFTVEKWKKVMTSDHYLTQILAEANELITDSGIQYKWWSKPVPVEKLDEWNVKIEVIDILHFYLSVIILEARNREIPVEAFKEMFFGIDSARLLNNDPEFNGVPLLVDGNKLDYGTYIQIMRSMLMVVDPEIPNSHFPHIAYAIMQSLVTAVGLSSQELSAVYTAKATLNRVRQTSGYKDGTYVKVQKDVEDNVRLQPIVERFLENTKIQLNGLSKAVRDEFFTTV